MIRQLKRQYHNIFKINAASFWPMFFSAALFPLRYKLNWDTQPVNIVWDITYRCNLDCKYCLFAKSKLHTIESELSFDKIRDFVRKMAKYKPSFFITGGEPLLRVDLEDIVREIRKNKMKVGINTNSTLLTKDRLMKLDEAGLNYMIISLDMDEMATDSVRGSGVYEKGLKAIKMIKDLGVKIKLVINCVVTEKNYQYLDKFLDFVEPLKIDALKLSYIKFNDKDEAIAHVGECKSRLGIDIKSDYFEKEIPGFGKEIAAKVASVLPKIKKMRTPVSFNPNLDGEEIVNWFNGSKLLKRRCLYLFNVVRLSPYGDIYPCHFINKPVGNITEDDFIKIYNNRIYKKIRTELKSGLFPGCVRCNKL